MNEQKPFQRPSQTLGLHHVALFTRDLDASVHFYVVLMGMEIEWQPDKDNIYLSSQGADNLALHRWKGSALDLKAQRLDHIGFIVRDMQSVDDWYQFLCAQQVSIVKAPKTHRDGARSFYCHDPDGTLVQIMYHPPISNR